MLAVLNTRQQVPLGRPVTRELVGDHDARCPALPLQQLAQQALGRMPVTPALDQHVEHHPVLIHGTPEPVLHPGDIDRDLVKVPLVASLRQPPPDPVGELLAELERPHCRTVSWLTTMPRAASISSTMRRLSGNRKYSQTAWLMISAGKRWPA